MLSRRDGIVMQYSKGGEDEGFNETDETPDRVYAEDGVNVLAELYSRMAAMKKKSALMSQTGRPTPGAVSSNSLNLLPDGYSPEFSAAA
jgi:hypothetical protein